MDLRHIRSFVTVVRERNFTRAAAKLHIAQPPLSRHIQLLEEELGVQLLVRTRPLRLTEAGRLFHEQSLQLLGRVDQLTEATRRVGGRQRSVLSIGFVPSTLYGGLPAVVRKLRARLPDVDIQLLELMSLQQIDALKTGRIDVAFGRVRANDPAVERTVLREERLVLAAATGTPLARSRSAIAIGDIVDQTLIVYPKEPRPSFADQVLTLLHDHGAVPARVEEVRELQTALGLVAAEAGVCIIPASARLMRSDLHYRLIDDERATSPVIMSHRVNDASPHIELIKDLIREIYEEQPNWLDPTVSLSAHPDFTGARTRPRATKKRR